MNPGMRRVLLSALLFSVLGTLIRAEERAVVTLRPQWPKFYKDEVIAFSCDIEGGGNATWNYVWETSSFIKPEPARELTIVVAEGHRGTYRCRGWRGNKSTSWSSSVRLSVSNYTPKAMLSASTRWLSAEASVTLRCTVSDGGPGWRFYWYATSYKVRESAYVRRQLPDSKNGTAKNTYVIEPPARTGRYRCEAGRGKGPFISLYSNAVFVWSVEAQPAAALAVSPDRPQHSSSEILLLTCKGTSTVWMVKRQNEWGEVLPCSDWGSMEASTCIIHSLQHSRAVYWCESDDGSFSNGVNITVKPAQPDSPYPLAATLAGILAAVVLAVSLFLLLRVLKARGVCASGNPRVQTISLRQQRRQDEDHNVYSSLHYGNHDMYDLVSGPDRTGNDPLTKNNDGDAEEASEYDDAEEALDYDDVHPC